VELTIPKVPSSSGRVVKLFSGFQPVQQLGWADPEVGGELADQALM
jgi:hypothetical protein